MHPNLKCLNVEYYFPGNNICIAPGGPQHYFHENNFCIELFVVCASLSQRVLFPIRCACHGAPCPWPSCRCGLPEHLAALLPLRSWTTVVLGRPAGLLCALWPRKSRTLLCPCTNSASCVVCRLPRVMAWWQCILINPCDRSTCRGRRSHANQVCTINWHARISYKDALCLGSLQHVKMRCVLALYSTAVSCRVTTPV